jgi:hypothetical protein
MTKTFLELTRDVVGRYLQTVVVVDELAYFPSTETIPVATPNESELTNNQDVQVDLPPELEGTPVISTAETLLPPGRKARLVTPSVVTPPMKIEVPIDQETTKLGLNAKGLNAKEVTDSFCRRELLCAVLRPEKNDEAATFFSAISKADLIVLDWQIYKDDGKFATEIVDMFLAQESSANARVRLIAIYTSSPDLAQIVPTITERINGKWNGFSNTEQDDFQATNGPLTVAVYAKEETTLPEYAKSRLVNVADLPGRLICDFAALNPGLLSNVVYEALSVLRNNMHHVLLQIHPKLDAPYLAHRALLPFPKDAVNFAMELVSSEIASVLNLSFSTIENLVGIQAIMSWLMYKQEDHNFVLQVEHPVVNVQPNQIAIILQNELSDTDERKLVEGFLQNINRQGYSLQRHSQKQSINLDLEAMQLLLEEGVEKWIIPGLTRSKMRFYRDDLFQTLTSVFTESAEIALDLDCEFSILTAFRRTRLSIDDRHRLVAPKLTLGVLVKLNEDYFLCLQPRCDSVRLQGKTKFVFLKLRKANPGEKFDYVVRHERTYIQLKLVFKHTLVHNDHFDPNPEFGNTVVAVLDSNCAFFVSVDNTAHRYEWIADLHPEQAQKIANKYAAILARVGLDESEWLRRSRGREE